MRHLAFGIGRTEGRISALTMTRVEQHAFQQSRVRDRIRQTGYVHTATLAVFIDRELDLPPIGSEHRHVFVNRIGIEHRLADADERPAGPNPGAQRGRQLRALPHVAARERRVEVTGIDDDIDIGIDAATSRTK